MPLAGLPLHSIAWKIMACALLLALAIDHIWGEPPAKWHPVVWMGHCQDWAAKRFVPSFEQHNSAQNFRIFCLGAFYWIAQAAIIFIVCCIIQIYVTQLPALIVVVVLALLLKPMLAWRMLREEVMAVEAALAQSLDAGRAQLSRLVSRDVSQLSAVQVRESAIETLAENLNDSVVAPIFWFALLGLPGAALYRFANTADAMWGYPGMRGGYDWQWAGKWAARADDVLSWMPARMTGMLIVIWQIKRAARLPAEAMRTPSPNSGWPMAAMALALNVRLAKPGVYVLNATGREAVPKDITLAVKLALKTLLAYILIAQTAMYLIA